VNPFREAALELHKIGMSVIPTGGVDGKRPQVRGWQAYSHHRPSTSSVKNWVEKFGDQNIAIVTGPASGVSIVDVDDEDLVGYCIDRFGEPGVIVRTPRGGFHLYFKNRGEATARGLDGMKIDIRAEGGLAVCPPSASPLLGINYEFVTGSFAEIASLTTMKGVAVSAREKSERSRSFRWLQSYGLRDVLNCDDLETLVDVLQTRNTEFSEFEHFTKLENATVERLAQRVWNMTHAGYNFFGTGGAAVIPNPATAALVRHPRALTLLAYLLWKRGAQRTEPFVLANATAKSIGWSVGAFRTARNRLVAEGILVCVRKGGRGPKSPPIYRFADMVTKFGTNLIPPSS
jgi:hypothetical protein